MIDSQSTLRKNRFCIQPPIDRRSADALVGVAAGLIADGAITHSEAQFLRDWLQNHLAHLHDPVINLLYLRVREMLADGVLDTDESAELFEVLRQFAGMDPSVADSLPQVAGNPLPFTRPVPVLEFSGKTYLFTGVMAFGMRRLCSGLVAEQGATVVKAISGEVDYLVVGGVGSEQWLGSSFGGKILEAARLREAGHGIAIISEDDFLNALFGG